MTKGRNDAAQRSKLVIDRGSRKLLRLRSCRVDSVTLSVNLGQLNGYGIVTSVFVRDSSGGS